MTNPYLATSLIASVKRKGWVPDSTGVSDADWLGFFNDETAVFMQAFLKSCREEYLVNEVDYDVAFTAAAPQVRVPTRCVGSALRTVSLVVSGKAYPLTRVDPEREGDYVGQTGTPVGFMLRGNVLRLLPTPTASGTLRLAYLQRAPSIVASTAVGEATVVTTTQVTVSSAPATFVSGVTLDFVQGYPPFSPLAMDVVPTVVAGSVFTFAASAIPSAFAVGDYLALKGETPIPLLPKECHQLLATRVAYVMALASGSARLDALKTALDEEMASVRRLLAPRVTASSRPLINPNGPGMRRARRY